MDSDGGELPGYAAELAALHEAHAAELSSAVARLPLHAGDRVLDLACGDGSFTRWISHRVAPGGEVVGVDVSEGFLAHARAQPGGSADARIVYARGDVRRLGVEPRSFDLAFCAHSLYSLPDPVEALRAMARCVRSGGHVAILENDNLHHALLPWPPELELAVRWAELTELERARDGDRYYFARRLPEAFREAGLEGARMETIVTTRNAPLSSAERRYLGERLASLLERANGSLAPPARRALEGMVDRDGADAPRARDELFVSYVDLLVLAPVD